MELVKCRPIADYLEAIDYFKGEEPEVGGEE